ERQGKALAILGGRRDVVSCKSVNAELVQSRQLPDGLLELTLTGRRDPVLLLVEFCTYPESRVPQQMHDDIQMVRQARGVLPDALALVLCRKGKLEVARRHEEVSELGFTHSGVGWKVQELWKLDAEEMLASPDVGVVPWVP